ncbi:outer membrane beta-barrel protein [Vibrio lentus]|nr:outer membrane beta-barrel protein [Vibrio lentus]
MVSLELQYTDFGDVVINSHKAETVYMDQIFSAAKNLGYTFDNAGVRPFGTIGLSSIDLDMKNSDGSHHSGATDDTGVRLGVGVEYTPTKHPEFSLRLGYEADTFTDTYESYSGNQKVEKT